MIAATLGTKKAPEGEQMAFREERGKEGKALDSHCLGRDEKRGKS